jgi:ABC-type multidrug transport system ATPase subunit
MYHDPDVLILDVATSALDNITKRAIKGDLHDLSRKETKILITYRLRTVKKCDKIFLLGNGQIMSQGTYSGLLAEIQEFKKMDAVNERLEQWVCDSSGVERDFCRSFLSFLILRSLMCYVSQKALESRGGR